VVGGRACHSRGGRVRSWSSVYMSMEHENSFNELVAAEVGAIAAAVGVNIGDLLTGSTSRGALDELEGIAGKFFGVPWLVTLVSDPALDDAAFGRALSRIAAERVAEGLVDPFFVALNAYLTKRSWMGDHDEDFSTTHWGEDASFVFGILRKSLRAVAAARGVPDSVSAALLPAPAASVVDSGAGATSAPPLPATGETAAPRPPWLDPPTGTAGGSAGASSGGKPATIPPAHPALMKRMSSVASDGGYRDARARLTEVLGDDHAIWSVLESLRLSLRWKEKIHIMYVRLGFNLKQGVKAWWLANSAAVEAIDPACTLASLYDTPFQYWLPVLRGQAPLADLVAAARAFATERAMWRDAEWGYTIQPHRTNFKVGDTAGSAAAAAAAAAAGDASGALPDLRGTPCSTGTDGAVVGVARVVPTLAQANIVQPGDIIVTHYTSPAWTPLLSLARAIVLEEGGILSHGAVVARECGIPAVASVRGVTAAVRSGDTLYVDGATGEVRVLSR